ncbi:MlaD family protein [Nocardioides daeguensis]|uniref:Mce/MlaD domain-containing protein n=1 Tax=Nocardioides daeguensis TaxID=908359 RepID=A0ABP6V3H0_9ACTN|nr:MlaD family protein [Nocardioides daeguensis]MBV6726509.1 MCE family protein [Nocardioides daeguensis]MCR1772352.1 MCE family protein [Nocardioides daeguensis]
MAISTWSRTRQLLALVAIAALVAAAWKVLGPDPYRLQVVTPAADQTFVGAQVLLAGHPVGKVSDIAVRDGRALLTLEVDGDHAPLPAGTTARIKWQSVLGARVVELTSGKSGNQELPSGHLLAAAPENVEVDDLLAMLDEPTRAQVKGLLAELNTTLTGNEGDLNKTLAEAGPTIEALGEVLRAVGSDGPAIKKIVSQFAQVADTVAARDGELSSSVQDLNVLLQAMAQRQGDLSETLKRLPDTIDTATKTLSGVKEPVDSARVLLREVAPATAKLPAITKDLAPVLAATRPALEEVPATLDHADRLLQRTPALVSGLRDLLPDADSALEQANPMVAFLRPYTPELAGWLSNWVGIFGSQNGAGNYARALITASVSSVDDLLPGVPVGQQQDARPEPGSIAKQTWADANGDAIQ